MSRRDDYLLVQDMVGAARAAVAAVEGKSIASLAADHIWALGLVKCLEIIGEAAGRLSEEFRQQHAAIPWRQVIGMRNRLVHAYFDIDDVQVWKTLTEDLPPLIIQLDAILTGEAREGS
jgi:uncharacterized protein with HEPN domain